MTALPAHLLVVTDRHQARTPLPQAVEFLLRGGASWIWLRDRDLPASERRELAASLLLLVRQAGGCLSIGDDIALAAETEADGVHLASAAAVSEARRWLGARAIIGVSAHGLADVHMAAEAGADYVTLSPIFATPSKPGYGPALGPEILGKAARLGVPVLALGGVTPERVGACRRAGAAGIAMMGEIMRTDHPEPLIGAVLRALADAPVDRSA